MDEIYFLSNLDMKEEKYFVKQIEVPKNNYHDPPTKYEKTIVEQFQQYLLHDIIDDNETR